MPLESIKPLNFDHYYARLLDIEFWQYAAKRIDWWNELRKYRYDDQDWMSGTRVRLDFYRRIRRAKRIGSDSGVHFDIANEIMRWGGMKPLGAEEVASVVNTMMYLDGLRDVGTADLEQLYINRLASVSKVYEMWQPDRWVITDSYCVRGWQMIVREFWKAENDEVASNLLRLPWPPGRTGQPVKGFPKMGQAARRQIRLGFLYTSWLCRGIAKYISEGIGSQCKFRAFHAEMSAFMIGHRNEV